MYMDVRGGTRIKQLWSMSGVGSKWRHVEYGLCSVPHAFSALAGVMLEKAQLKIERRRKKGKREGRGLQYARPQMPRVSTLRV